MNPSDLDIAELIPHAGNMVLVTTLLSYDDDNATTLVKIKNDNLFSGPADQVPAWVGIEYMAQTIAAWAGFKARLNDVPVRLGFLLGSRKYQCNVPAFFCGDELNVVIEKIFDEDSGLASFTCRIEGIDRNGTEVEASANLNVFQPNTAQVDELMGNVNE